MECVQYQLEGHEKGQSGRPGLNELEKMTKDCELEPVSVWSLWRKRRKAHEAGRKAHGLCSLGVAGFLSLSTVDLLG